MFNPQHSPDEEEDKYGTVKRVVSTPQSKAVTNQERKAPTPCPLSSPLIGSTPLKGPAPDTNSALHGESALLIGSTLSDLSLLTNSSLFTDSSFLSHSTSLGSLCSTPTEGKIMLVHEYVLMAMLLNQNNCFRKQFLLLCSVNIKTSITKTTLLHVTIL